MPELDENHNQDDELKCACCGNWLPIPPDFEEVYEFSDGNSFYCSERCYSAGGETGREQRRATADENSKIDKY